MFKWFWTIFSLGAPVSAFVLVKNLYSTTVNRTRQESEVWCFKLSFSTGCTKWTSAAIRSLHWKNLSAGFWSCALQRHYQWNQCEKKITWPSFSRNCKGYWSDAFLTALPSEVRDFKSGGGTPLYKPYMYVQPQREGFLRCWSKKTGIDFTHLGLESGMVLEGTRRSVWTNSLFQFQLI